MYLKPCRAGCAGVCVFVVIRLLTAVRVRVDTKKRPTDVETSQKHKTLI